MTQFRQGDVLIRQIATLPTNATVLPLEGGRVILAHGEVTGHAHAVDATVSKLFEVSGVEDRFLEVTRNTAVTHEEHDSIQLAPGIYQVIRQREFCDLDQVRRVVD